MRTGTLTAILLTAAALFGGCRVRASASASTQAKAKVHDFDVPLDEETAIRGSQEPLDDAPESYAMLGARHDLVLTPQAARTAQCECLAVAVGSPADPSFRWQEEPPHTDAQTQLVVALSSEGVPCEAAPKDSLGASYWGYRRSGDDVVVYVENARFGRPLTAGAVIPKPMGDGQVLVRPTSKSVPYGRGLGDDKPCELGNPGPIRTLDDSPEADDRPEFQD